MESPAPTKPTSSALPTTTRPAKPDKPSKRRPKKKQNQAKKDPIATSPSTGMPTIKTDIYDD
ncbi:MAG TPA: hypothetical protein ENJ18_02720 [Nannocystis exedens]|nr:hypothetical protein [Nannocystis exedens]